MIDEFLKCLLGKWTNKEQAYSDPTTYAWAYALWEDIGDGRYQSKQWYNYAGEDSPYRLRINTFSVTDSGIVIENWIDGKIRNPLCDVIVTYDGEKWKGENLTNGCIVRDAVLKSEFILTKDYLMSRDGGYVGDELKWGSKNFYHFKRI